MLDEKEWESVLSVAEVGTFSLAARKMFVSQPCLSQSIKRIEKELGVQLFDRNLNHLQLTPAGEIYVEEALKLKKIKHDFLERLSELSNLKTGTLQIGSTYTRSACFLRDALVKFCNKFPGIKVNVYDASSFHLKEELQNNKLDFAFLHEPLDRNEFSVIPFIEEKVLLAVPNGHKLAMKEVNMPGGSFPAISFKELDGEPFINLKRTRKMREIYDDLCLRTGVKPNVVYESNSLLAAADLCAKGMGITFVTDTLLRCFNPDVSPVYYELEEPVEARRLVIARHKTKRLSKAANAFIDLLMEAKNNI